MSKKNITVSRHFVKEGEEIKINEKELENVKKSLAERLMREIGYEKIDVDKK